MIFRIFAVIWLSFNTDIQQQVADALITPEVATVVEGDSSVFRCFNDNKSIKDFQIQFKQTGSSELIILYSHRLSGLDPHFAQNYSVTKNVESGYFDLQVLKVSTSLAGVYTCDWGNRTESAELVVVLVNSVCSGELFWNEPQNTGTRDYCGTVFKLECSAIFTGNRPPNIGFWMDLPNGERIGPLNASSALTGSNVSQNILSQELTPDHSGSQYLCLPHRQGTVPGNNIRSVCSFNNPNLTCKAAGWSKTPWIILVVVLGVVVVGVVAVVVWYFYWRRKARRNQNNQRNPSDAMHHEMHHFHPND